MQRVVQGVVSGLFVLVLSACSSSEDSPASNDSQTQTSYTVVAVDGYIKGATISDAVGKTAIYSGTNGVYTFSELPTYPLILQGGTLEDTNLPFDINLSVSDDSIKVLSPVVTYLNLYPDTLAKLSTLNLGATTLAEFGSDYIENNNTNLAVASQLFYIILHDTNLSATFTQSLESNTTLTSFDDLLLLADAALYDSSIDATMRSNYHLFFDKLSALNSSAIAAIDIETELKPFKVLVKNSYKPASFIATLATAQSVSYESNSSFDDGALQRGLVRSFTRDSVKEVVVDNVTHLMWQDDNDTRTLTKNWKDAVMYCEDLSIGGFGDWRLPSIEELMSIADKGKYDPAIDATFQNRLSNSYWSATMSAVSNTDAWLVNFSNNANYWFGTSYTLFVRCVRNDDTGTTTSLTEKRFERDDVKEVVTDLQTNLMWQDNNDTKLLTKNWQDSIDYCEGLNLGGFSDWHLPNYNELWGLADRSRTAPAMDATFENIINGYYWSSSSDKSDPSYAWRIYFNDGNGKNMLKTYGSYVRCVRDKN